MNLVLCCSSASFRELNGHQDESKVDGIGVDRSFKCIVSTAKVTGLSPLYETKGKTQKLHLHGEFILYF